jgi:outer membrane immunogenic protein
MHGSGTGTSSFGGVILFSATADEHIRWFGTVRARVGFIPIENLLTYATGGFAYGRVEHTGNYVNNGIFVLGNGGFGLLCTTTCFSGSSSETMSGWTAGGGLEYALSKNVTVKAEYLYVSLATNSFPEFALNPFTVPQTSYNANYNRTTFNVVRAGLNFRF